MAKLELIAKDLNSYVNFQNTRILKEEGVEYIVDAWSDDYPDELSI